MRNVYSYRCGTCGATIEPLAGTLKKLFRIGRRDCEPDRSIAARSEAAAKIDWSVIENSSDASGNGLASAISGMR